MPSYMCVCQLADQAESPLAMENVVTPSKVQLHRRSRLLVQLGWIVVFARTPTPSVQNAAWLAPTQLSRIFDKRILEKIIVVTSGVVVVTRNTPAFPSAQRTIGLQSAQRHSSLAPASLNQQTSRCDLSGCGISIRCHGLGHPVWGTVVLCFFVLTFRDVFEEPGTPL